MTCLCSLCSIGIVSKTPEWIRSQRRALGLCETCGQNPPVTVWAGTGEHICWQCCDRKRAAGQG